MGSNNVHSYMGCILATLADVCFTPIRGHWRSCLECPLRAKSGHRAYSITSSAVASSDCGMIRPSVLRS